MIKQKANLNFHYSFLIIFYFSLLLSPASKFIYFDLQKGSILKLFFNIYIYVCLFFLPYSSFKILNQFYNKKFIIIFYIIIVYGFIRILTVLDQSSLYISIFGNPHFGPIFFVPLFFLWGTQVNSIYWFNKISLLSIKVGILLTPICLILSVPLPISAFLPAYYILAGFNYVSFRDKIWIILGIIVGIYCFYETGYRAGVFMILFSLSLFLLLKLNLKLLNKTIIILLFTIPLLILFNQFYGDESIFETITNYFSPESIWAIDTRTLITKDLLLDLTENKKILFGKGPLGTYYNEFFDKLQYFTQGLERGQPLRATSEIGILHYMIKGGLFYVFLIFIISLSVSLNAHNQSKNDYLNYLSLYLGSYFMFSAIENPPLYNFKHISMWIIMAICASKFFLNLKNSEIKELITYKI